MPELTQKPNVRFGRNARMYIAPYAAGGAEPAFDQYTYFCATDQIEIGGQKGSETVNNFCTGGNDVELSDGSETPSLSTGDAFWTENDRALQILEAAYDNNDPETNYVWYRIYPLGLGKGKPVYRGLLQVNEWKLTIPSKGFIKMSNGLNPTGKPEKGTAGANNTFVPAADGTAPAPAPATINGGALSDNVATNLPDMSANQVSTYTVTSTAPGDITVVTAGTSTPRTVSIVDASGTQQATGTDGASYAAAPAGTYTVRVTGTQASTGGTVTADYLA